MSISDGITPQHRWRPSRASAMRQFLKTLPGAEATHSLFRIHTEGQRASAALQRRLLALGVQALAWRGEQQVRRPRARGPRSHQAEMTAAVRALRAEGRRFRTKKEQWRAVIERLGISETERGWSYKTFVRLKFSN
jgi:hypothetical protein